MYMMMCCRRRSVIKATASLHMRTKIFVTVLLLFVVSTRAQDKPTCGYSSCPAVIPGKLNVHLVPHTHDDVGWLKTVDQYFFGTRMEIQHAGVKTIIDSVLSQLELDPSRRFIWVESAFLWQWWTQQTDETMREKMRRLVNSGQLEITGGGWSMNDEAVTHYQSTIDQFTWGFRKLNDTFGTCGRPHVGWQIDPFGHSRETASLMARMGFDGLFFARLDYRDKETRMQAKKPEFVWQASQNLGESSWLFTNVLFNHYSPPPGFCFDILCHDHPIIDDRTNPDYNLEERITLFMDHAREQAASYNTDNIFMTMGNDFNYMDADVWYTNLDKLIKYVNARGEMNVFYSTPACYLKAVNNANLTWSTKQDDFFPYASDAHSYWTGYFTSRPTLKYFERLGNNFLQVCKQLHALASVPEDHWVDLSSLRETMGIMQHHDAITGTEKQHVAYDYAMRLSQAFADCHNASNIALNKLMASSESSPKVEMQPCMLLNISQCAVSEQSDTFVVTAYNPLARIHSPFIRLPVPLNNYKVFDPTGSEVTVQLVPIPQSVLKIPGRDSSATQELVFKATELPPLGYKMYYVQKSEDSANVVQPVSVEDRLNIQNQHLSAHIDGATNSLVSVKRGDMETKMEQSFRYYEGHVGGNWVPETRCSGAYIFRPTLNDSKQFETQIKSTTYKGLLVQEIHQEVTDWISQVIRIYEGEYHMELEWQVGPIPIEDGVGKEIISRLSTGWATNGVFYTDSNGRETLERKRNLRASWEVDMQEPVSANYYPVTSHIAIRNENKEFAVLPDRAQGGSSIHDGEIELMVHRRLLYDDAFGVSEALNETAFDTGLVARGRHVVVFGSYSETGTANTVSQLRCLSQSHQVLPPWLLFTPTKLSLQEWRQNYLTQYSGLTTSLPDNVHLLTLEPWKENSLLMRLEHFFEKTDDSILSIPATVSLQDIFSAFTVASVQETTLGANQHLEDNSRLVWKVQEGENQAHSNLVAPASSNSFKVTLEPMQIRTFIVEVTPKSTQPPPARARRSHVHQDDLRFNVYN